MCHLTFQAQGRIQLRCAISEYLPSKASTLACITDLTKRRLVDDFVSSAESPPDVVFKFNSGKALFYQSEGLIRACPYFETLLGGGFKESNVSVGLSSERQIGQCCHVSTARCVADRSRHRRDVRFQSSNRSYSGIFVQSGTEQALYGIADGIHQQCAHFLRAHNIHFIRASEVCSYKIMR